MTDLSKELHCLKTRRGKPRGMGTSYRVDKAGYLHTLAAGHACGCCPFQALPMGLPPGQTSLGSHLLRDKPAFPGHLLGSQGLLLPTVHAGCWLTCPRIPCSTCPGCPPSGPMPASSAALFLGHSQDTQASPGSSPPCRLLPEAPQDPCQSWLRSLASLSLSVPSPPSQVRLVQRLCTW